MSPAKFEVASQDKKQIVVHSPSQGEVVRLRRLLDAYDRLLDCYMPPAILVDEQWNVVDTYAGADQYLRFPSRRPTQSLLDVVCEPMRMALMRAIDQLNDGHHPAMVPAVMVSGGSGESTCLSLSVSRVPVKDLGDAYFSIVLQSEDRCEQTQTVAQPPCYSIQNLLAPAVREQPEADFVSIDSIITSRPQITPDAVPRDSDDLDRFVDSAQLAVVFLDQNLRIRRFSAPAAKMFDLVQHDVGREIRTFASVLEVPDLVDRIRAVVHTGDADEVEVHQHRTGRYLIARITPDRAGNRIEGVVLTLIDLSRQEMRHRESRILSSIVLSTDDAIIGRDRENRIITWNAAAEEMFGFSAKEAIGQDASLIIPAGQEAEYSQTLRVLQKGGRLDHFESVRQTKCGRLIKVSVRLSPIYDDDHRVIGMSTIERDISRQIEVIDRLTASDRKYQDYYHQSPEMYGSFDAVTGSIVDCNDRMCQMLGYSRAEILGRPVIDLHAASCRDAVRGVLTRFRSAGEVHQEDLELVKRDGSVLPVSLHATAIHDESGTVVRSRCVWHDMSAVKRKEEQVRQSEQRYRNSFQNSAIGIAQVDLDGRYLMTNRRISEIVGYSPEELAELRFSDITHPDDLADEMVLRDELLCGHGETYKLEKRYIHKAGHEVWASLFVSLERDAEGRPVSSHSYVEDISSRKELEAELRLAISQRDQFLAMLSHELRNPLGAILNTCAVLNRGRGLPKTMQQPISIVTRQARQMAELLDDLLDVSRITTGKIKLEKSPVVLSEIVDEAVESQQGLAVARHQRLIVTYADEPLHIFGDRSRLVQVVVNLLNNAIKYSGDGGVIKITLERKGRLGLIRVKDSGVGIEPELIESLFEMFAQKDSTLDRSGGGMGLGLHLVRKLVEFHSGRVTGYSEGVGKGSEFVVELPVSNRVRSSINAKNSLKETGPTLPPIERIVVVEDIADARNMLVALLEADDYQVSAAADGEAGLQLILKEKPDLAIVDIGLPKLDGYEIAKRVRAELAGAQITMIALSGYGQDSDYERAIAAGFDMHMVKPLNTARLEKILSR